MKPTKDWTKQEVNGFFDKLIGEYNAWPYVRPWDFFSSATFIEVLKPWMEKEQAELWHKYLLVCFYNLDLALEERLDLFFNPRNLVEFLLSDKVVGKWGWLNCSFCGGNGKIKGEGMCDNCLGACKEMHPALEYAESVV